MGVFSEEVGSELDVKDGVPLVKEGPPEGPPWRGFRLRGFQLEGIPTGGACPRGGAGGWLRWKEGDFAGENIRTLKEYSLILNHGCLFLPLEKI